MNSPGLALGHGLALAAKATRMALAAAAGLSLDRRQALSRSAP
jgi:hypothetical protein